MSRGLKMTPSINSFLNPSTVFNPSLKPCCANSFTSRFQTVPQCSRSLEFLTSAIAPSFLWPGAWLTPLHQTGAERHGTFVCSDLFLNNLKQPNVLSPLCSRPDFRIDNLSQLP